MTLRSKVVLISGSDPREPVTGHRTYVRAHALAAKAAGYSPQVFIVSDRNAVEETEFGTVHRVASPIRPFYTLTAPAHQPFLARGVVRYLSAHREPHLVHSFGAWSGTGVAASRAAGRKGIKTVPIASVYTTLDHEADAKVRGLGHQYNVARRLLYRGVRLWTRAVAVPTERWGYRGSRLVLVNYESVRALVEAQCGPAVAIRRVPYAAPAAFEARAELPRPVPAAVAALQPADAPLIVSVSRHDPRKGVDVLLRALAGLAAAGVPFRACLVGSGALLADHLRLRDALGLDGNVAITGHVPDVIDYLSRADVFVLPSLQEGSGSVSLLEALQAGVAVVASDCDGIPEDVTRDRDALLVPPGDWRALRDALARLMTDEPLRARLAAQARQVYDQRFTSQRFVSGLAELYEELGFGVDGLPPIVGR